MWQLYKKRFALTQLFIAALLLVAMLVFHKPRNELVIMFIAMQIGAVLGAAMGKRINNQADRADEPPLTRL